MHSMTCKTCNTTFTATRSDAKFCSPKCRKKYNRNIDRLDRWSRCANCKDLFRNPSKRRRYCSDACKQDAYRSRQWDEQWGYTINAEVKNV